MTFRNTAYNTTLGYSFPMAHTAKAIKEALVKDPGLEQTNMNLISSLNIKPVFITGIYHSESNIPLFHHPLIVSNIKGHKLICTDLRSFVKPVDGEGNTGVYGLDYKNLGYYQFNYQRAILNTAWVNGSDNELRLALGNAAVIYSYWISENIAKIYALDPKDQIFLQILSYIFYNTLFTDDHEAVADRTASKCAKDLNVPVDAVYQVMDRAEGLDDIAQFCQSATTVLNNIKLKNFNEGVLISAIGNSWFSMNSKELLAMALEHPPTWLAILHVSVTDRSYKNTQIATIASRVWKTSGTDNFITAYKNVLKPYINTEMSAEDILDTIPVFE